MAIRVLVVDDSMFFRETLARGISQDPNIEVIGKAENPFDARDKILTLKPDVLTLDVEMPKMSGIEFLHKLIPQYPIPVVLVSSVNMNVFDALNAGAVDFVKKPDVKSPADMSNFITELISKVKVASTAKVRQPKARVEPAVKPSTVTPPKPATSTSTGTTLFSRPATGNTPAFSATIARPKPIYEEAKPAAVVSPLISSSMKKPVAGEKLVIAIGASTGGTEATIDVIKDLPADTPAMVIVQHMPPLFTKMYAERLNKFCNIEVKEAEDGDELRVGLALLAPGDKQMQVVSNGKGGYKVKCYQGEKVSGHCPSVDVMFDSVADVVGENALGVILTGMGRDGANGLLKMRKKGAYTIGQDKETSVVYGMPMVAYDIGAVVKQAPLDKIANLMTNYVNTKR